MGPRHIDITGQRFGRLVVVERRERRHPTHGAAMWLCRCDCGAIREVVSRNLRKGITRSCGCIRIGRPSGKTIPPLSVRFWEKVEKTDSCWLWRGAGDRYGHIRDKGRTRPAHHVSWELHGNESVPDGMELCHRCDVGKCVRPDHLFLGTHTDNMRDMSSKGRHVSPFRDMTHCKRGHPRTAENVRLSKAGNPQCRVCHRILAEKYRRRMGMRPGKVTKPRHFPDASLPRTG